MRSRVSLLVVASQVALLGCQGHRQQVASAKLDPIPQVSSSILHSGELGTQGAQIKPAGAVASFEGESLPAPLDAIPPVPAAEE